MAADIPNFLARAQGRYASITSADLAEAAMYWPDEPADQLRSRIERERFDMNHRAAIEERVRRERAALGLPDRTVVMLPPRRET